MGFVELLGCLIGSQQSSRLDRLAESSQNARVNLVCLRKHPERFGKISSLSWIDSSLSRGPVVVHQRLDRVSWAENRQIIRMLVAKVQIDETAATVVGARP